MNFQEQVARIRKLVGGRRRCRMCGRIIKNRPNNALYCLRHTNYEANRRIRAQHDPEFRERQNARFRRYRQRKKEQA